MIKEIKQAREKHEHRGELIELLVTPGVPPAEKLHAAIVLKQFYLDWLQTEVQRRREYCANVDRTMDGLREMCNILTEYEEELN